MRPTSYPWMQESNNMPPVNREKVEKLHDYVAYSATPKRGLFDMREREKPHFFHALEQIVIHVKPQVGIYISIPNLVF